MGDLAKTRLQVSGGENRLHSRDGLSNDWRHGCIDAFGDHVKHERAHHGVVLQRGEDPPFPVTRAGRLVQERVRADQCEQLSEIASQPQRSAGGMTSTRITWIAAE